MIKAYVVADFDGHEGTMVMVCPSCVNLKGTPCGCIKKDDIAEKIHKPTKDYVCGRCRKNIKVSNS